MTVASVMQNASLRLIGRKPQEFFSSGNTFEQKLVSLVNEVAIDIARSHDWSRLLRVVNLSTSQSDGASLPDDYDRMPVGQGIPGYRHETDMREWANSYGPSWHIKEGKVYFNGPTAGLVAFPYISTNYAINNDGVELSEFKSDADSFVLDNRLMTLGLIWRWREMERLDSAGDMEQFQKAFSEQAARDGGSRVIATRRPGGLPYNHAWTGRIL